jgi:membrane glycosyltransferase
VALGALGAVGAFFLSHEVLLWTSPVFLSLTLSALLSVRTSRRLSGEPSREPLFQTPEDADPPPVLQRARMLRGAYAAERDMRWKIEALMRAPAAVYEVGRMVVAPVSRPLAAAA